MGSDGAATPIAQMTTYPAHYAVNDRPVKLVLLADGRADCLVLDMRSGRLVPDRSYFAAVAPGSGKDVDALAPMEFDALVMVHRARMLRTWCERLCSSASSSTGHILTALGVAIEPPPLDAEQVHVSGGELVSYVEFRLPLGALDREALDAALGTPTPVPPLPSAGGTSVVYQVRVPGGRFQVSAFADLHSRAGAHPVRRLLLRLDRPAAVAPMPPPVT